MSGKKIQPFEPFGKILRSIREQSQKTSDEVSGAVEIESSKLSAYELGKTRPSEDILLLLIKHFDVSDDQARELWRLAGYGDQPMDESLYFTNDTGEYDDLDQFDHMGHGHSHAAMMMPHPPVVYTDMIQVMVNNYGVIMNFMQGAGSSPAPLAVARIGMSKEHARSVLSVLQKTLEQADELEAKSTQPPKQLPPGKD